MPLEDPFFVVKDELLKALLKTRDLFERWRMREEGRELRSAEEQEWAITELRNSLRSIEWDLEDLDDTIEIVEKNPSNFRIDPSELLVRKAFIQQTRGEVNQMKLRTSPSNVGDGSGVLHEQSLDPSPDASSGQIPNSIKSQNTTVVGLGSTKYSRLSSGADSPIHSQTEIGHFSSTQQMIQQQQTHQDQLLGHQDRRLQFMCESVGNLRNVSGQIGNELDEQAMMLDEFGTEIENAESKLDATMRKMAKVLYMSNDRRQWMAIVALSSAMVILIIIIFAL